MSARIPLAELTDGVITRITDGDDAAIVIRDGDTVRAFAATCPHAGAPMEQGALCRGRLICPWHKSVFRLDDGGLLEPPALESLPRYPVRIENETAIIEFHPLPAPAITRRRHARIAALIGSGAAGAAAAITLRQAGYDGRVLLIGPEALQPYDRTVLSKFVLAGDMKPTDLPPLQPGNAWDALDVEQIDTAVQRLDATTRRIEFADGTSLHYDTALLAPGGAPIRPTIPGIDLTGVHTLRNAQDAAAIVGAAQPGQPVVIIGASFIGLEAASALRKRGAIVTVVAPDRIPFARQFGDTIGATIRRLHEANGVTFRLEQQVVALERTGDGQRVLLKDGDQLSAKCVVVGTGVRPATDFVSGVDKSDDGGITVDAGLRAADGLYVAGDCARFPWRGEHIRVEHWRLAQQHARVAAQGMLGRAAHYEGVPYFWTYHYGQNIEYLGHASTWDDIHIDGDLDAHDFIAFQMREGQVAAVIACGRETQTAALIEPMREKLTLQQAQAIVARPG